MRLINRWRPPRPYPVCTVCGQSVSPLSSDRQREHFEQSHEERCGKKIVPVGFYADVVADALSLPACDSQTAAYSVLEVLRFAATRVLDMHMDDLQVLVIGHVGREEVDALLWDPMPGGSGLLDQMCERFDEIIGVSREIVANRLSFYQPFCVDCLQTFRNAHYHKHLDRKLALERLDAWGRALWPDTKCHTSSLPRNSGMEPNRSTKPSDGFSTYCMRQASRTAPAFSRFAWTARLAQRQVDGASDFV